VQEVHKAAYTILQPDKQEAVRVSARERFLLYALIKTSNSKHDKIKDNLPDDYTKGSDNYPQTQSQALMLMDHYSKTPAAITTSEERHFLRRVVEIRKETRMKRRNPMPTRIRRTLIKCIGSTRSAISAARMDILPQLAQPKLFPVMMTRSQPNHLSLLNLRVSQQSKCP
jgi:hypothetical protein